MRLSLGRGLMPVGPAGPGPSAGNALLTEDGRPLGTQSNAVLMPETAPAPPAGGMGAADGAAAGMGLLTEDGRLVLAEDAMPVAPAAGPGVDPAHQDFTLLTLEAA